MAQTTVKTPDGNRVTVNHPEGATEAQILRYAKQQYSPAPKVELEPESASPLSDSSVENFLAGTGKGMNDIFQGARQRLLELSEVMSRGFPASAPGVQKALAEQNEQIELARERDQALMGTKAGTAGAITGNIAATLPFGGLATTLPRAAALGAVEGGLMPTVEGESAASNAVTGGAFGAGGQLAARGLGRAFRPFSKGLSSRADDAAELLRKEGVPLDVAQRTGSENAQRVRSALGDNPFTASGQRRMVEKQSKQFTKAVLRTIGEDADEATPAVLNRARQRVGQEIDEAVSRNPAFLDNSLRGEIDRILQTAPASVGDDAVVRSLQKNAEMIADSVDNFGRIPGGVFRSVRSNLSQLSRKTPLAREMQDAMFDALERSGNDPAKLKKAIAQYRNINLIENSIDKGSDKFISPLRLSNTVNQIRNRPLGLRNLGHESSVKLAKLAEAGREFLPETIGNSGTAARQLTAEAMLFGGGMAGGLASGQDVGDAALIGAGAAAAPFALQRLMNSQGAAGNIAASGLPGANAINSAPIQALIRQGVISSGLINQ